MASLNLPAVAPAEVAEHAMPGAIADPAEFRDVDVDQLAMTPAS
jgi:hypothetical protein